MAKQTDPNLGPCMRALNERQQAFVMAASQMDATERNKGWRKTCAILAGYTGDDKYLRVQGHRLAHDPKVLAAMKEVALGTMHAASIPLTAMLLDIAYGDIPSTATEKLKAAAMIFNRIGMPETTEHNVRVEHNVNTDDAMTKLTKFAKVLNLDPAQLLGHVGVAVVDGEFTEVEPKQIASTHSEDMYEQSTYDEFAV